MGITFEEVLLLAEKLKQDLFYLLSCQNRSQGECRQVRLQMFELLEIIRELKPERLSSEAGSV